MAEENLGTAVLRIEVDDSLAKQTLDKLKQDITRISRTTGGRAGGRVQGGARESIRALEQAQERRFRLAQRIQRLEDRGGNVSRLRTQLGAQTEAQSKRQFESSRRISLELSRQVRLAEARLQRENQVAAALTRQTRLGGPSESIRGRVGLAGSPADVSFLARQGGARSPIGGAVNIPGSPAFLAAESKAGEAQARAFSTEAARLARQGGARSLIGGATNIPGSPAAIRAEERLAVARERAAQAAEKAIQAENRRIGRQNVSPLRGGLAFPGSPGAIGAARQEGLRLGRLNAVPVQGGAGFPGSPAAIRAEERLTAARERAAQAAQKATEAEGRRIGRLNASPIRGGAAFPGSPAFLESQTREAQAASRRQQAATVAEAKSRRQDLQGRISSGLIGGAFPLLFGQGPGAALGGLAGGVAGGGAFGFGASLVGTGIGASFDALIARSRELAEALRDPIAAFDQLKTTSALSSRGLETYIEALIKSGQTAAAEQLIRADLTRTLNPTTAAALSQANDELARSFSDVQEKLAAITAGPAIAFLQWLDDIIDRLPIQGPAGAEFGQLPTAEQGRSQQNRGRFAQFAGAGALISAGLIATLATGGLAAVPGAALIAGGVASVGTGALVAGTAANAAGARVPEDLATQQRTAGIQKEIEATQARRITLQKQLIGFTGNEASGAAQLAQTQQVVLAAQQASLEALKTLTSLPQSASIDERIEAEKAYKEAVAASLIEVEKLIAANNNQARNLKRATDLRERTTGFSSSGRQGAVLTDAVVKAREDYDKAKAALEVTSIAGLEAARSDVNKFGQQWRSATQDLADYNAELRITAQLDTAQTNLALQGIGERITATQALAQAERGVARDTLATTQAIQAGINEAKRREQEIGAQIDAARQRGDESGAASLVNQQKVAANETRLELEKGALALTEAGEQLRDNLRNAIVDFTRIRSDPQGLNRFLNPQQQQERAQRDFQLLLPQFREAQSRFRQLTGANAPEFTGSAAGVNESIRDFINATRTEDQATRDLIGTQKALDINTQALTKNTADLAAKIADLNSKNWLVNVAVSGAQSAISGDVLNGAVSP